MGAGPKTVAKAMAAAEHTLVPATVDAGLVRCALCDGGYSKPHDRWLYFGLFDLPRGRGSRRLIGGECVMVGLGSA